MNKLSERGFSLIELMIVVMIIGVLGAAAIPAYKDYMFRAKTVDLFAAAQTVKLAVAEALISGIPKAEISNEKLGLEKIENQGNVKELSVANAIITIIGDPKTFELPDNKAFKIALIPKTEGSTIQWECKAEPSEFKKYAPANCRE